MKKLLLLLAIGSSLPLYAQVTDVLPNGKSIANTSVARTDTWCGFSNPAGLIQPTKFQAAIQFENKYMLSELSTKMVQVASSNKIVNVGIAFSHFGYQKYNEMLIGIALSKNFGDKFSMGVQGNYYTAYFSDEAGYQGTFLPQIGITAHLSAHFTLGFQAFNPFQQELKTDFVEKRIPSIFSLGSNYLFAKNFRWVTQIDKEVSSNFRFATGFEWDMIKQLTVKLGGYGSEFFVGCLGVGFHFGNFGFDLHCELHPLLGVNMAGNLNMKL